MLSLEKSSQLPDLDPGLLGDGGERTTAGMDCSPQVPG